ncbi:MAG: proton-conducting transporter membrane subunit [Candidatus Omnitrophota bacterium]|nr:proton-conducting transporter membrane subunit [Candidatus Omnitrophota bacterium]
MNLAHLYPYFKLDSLNGFVVLAIGFFTALTLLYSATFMKGRPQPFQYYSYILLTAIAAVATVLANNLILLLILWGFLGLTLYLLININRGSEDSALAAKKTFIIVGGSDALMLLGIGIIYYLTQTLQMDRIKLEFSNGLAILAYVLIAIAAFAKAGAMPFHSWIPDCAKSAPIPVVSYLPASLDKLLGIYLLARMSLDLFVMNTGMNIFLMIVGAFTILAAVMMALIQHDMKRLLGYHAVSQVGYMILGIGTGNPIGIAGGLFHMLNNAIYKSCLFFTSGNVEYRTHTSELDKLGGLAKAMPITYICALIASLSISGVPPFSGFVSKWMVYQGLINNLSETSLQLRISAIICLVAAMFGSGLTLASFMKLLHATFLGRASEKEQGIKEVSWGMWLPCAILAIICVGFGVFAYQIPLKFFILPAVKEVNFIGSWYAGLSTLLIITGLVVGWFIFKLKGLRSTIRQDAPFVGGENWDLEKTRVTGTDFYLTVKEIGILKAIYHQAEKGAFDIYDQGKNLLFGVGKFLQLLHNGVLPTYLVWTLLGMIGLFFALFR